MASPKNILALNKVSSEIDESESKIIFTNQCIKAQEDLCNKLKQEIKRYQEQWYFMKMDNQKLEAEIKNAENEIKCSSTAIEAIRGSNVELRKELLIAKDSYKDLIQRVTDGEKKYDIMWLEAKERFEWIPFVQERMKATQDTEILKRKLEVLDQEAQMLEDEERQKKRQVLVEERKIIINLAEFLKGYNAAIKNLKDKQEEVAKLAKEVEKMKAEQSAKKDKVSRMSKFNIKPAEAAASNIIDEENWLNLCRNIYDDSLMMPRHPSTTEKDVLDVKLDLKKDPTQVTSIKRAVSMSASTSSTKRVDVSLNEQYMSCYFGKPQILESNEDTGTTSEYSKKKLINILDDIQLDDNETYDIISKTNPDDLQEVSVIAARANPVYETNGKRSPKNDKGPIVSEEIEEVDLTARNSQTLLLPPSQFADKNEVCDGGRAMEDSPTSTRTVIVNMSMEQTVQGGQKNAAVKKMVSFDIPVSVSVHDISEEMDVDDPYKPDDTIDSVTVTGHEQEGETANDDNDGFINIQEMLLKKHTLDLSPQFVYGKNNASNKKTDENVAVITSKFFETNVEGNEKQTDEKPNNKIIEKEKVPDRAAANEKQLTTAPTKEVDNENSVDMDGDNMKSPPAKRQVAGTLFTHGPEGIPDCLDTSLSTTGYEEGDADFRQYLDRSLVMSPNAENRKPPMSLSGNPSEVDSQDVPNFLSGYKTAGFSFFKSSPGTSSEANPENQENHLNFNFGGSSSQEKKSKGLFSFFH